jgi:hypothetical protein
MKRLIHLCLTLTATLASFTLAQQTADEATIATTVGTSIQGSDGRQWAVVFWQPPLGEPRREIALYRKAGAASAPGAYSLIGRIIPDPTRFVINARLKQGAILGDDLAVIDSKMSNYFGDYGIDPALDVTDKVTAISYMVSQDADLARLTRTMTRFHPALALAMGEAFADPVNTPGLHTYELREVPAGVADPDNAAVVVRGRVTIHVGTPAILTAPGPLLETSEPSPRGDLQARLVWAIPDDLMRQSMLMAGYNVYRASVPFTQSTGWNVVPPAAGDLALATLANPTDVQRVNGHTPVLPPRRYPSSELTQISTLVSQGGSVEDVLPDFAPFIIDDNDRHQQGGAAFTKGAEYYYFACARDLFGRDGASSSGLYVQLCKRIPPPGPRDVSVFQDADFDANGDPTPYFTLNWDPVEGDAEDVILSYEVYRWRSIEEFTTNEAQPAAFLAGQPIVVSGGETEFSFDDNDPGDAARPQAPADFGTTFFYTVRAATSNGCGGLTYSPHSAPTFAVLRSFRGPDNPTGNLVTTQQSVSVTSLGLNPLPGENPADVNLVRLRLSAFVLSSLDAFASVEFLAGTAVGPMVPLAVGLVSPASGGFTTTLEVPASSLTGMTSLFCRATTKLGVTGVSAPAPLPPDFVENVVRAVDGAFEVNLILQELPKTPGSKVPHVTRQPNGSFAPVKIDFTLTAGTEEYRVYRSIDDRPETLIAQGLASASQTARHIVADQATPVNGGKICYSVQLFDKDQNPSGLTFVDCVRAGARTAVPVPELKEVTTAGSAGSPQLRLKWFCPVNDIDRFLVYAAVEGEAPPSTLGTTLRDTGFDLIKSAITSQGGSTQEASFRAFLTPRIAMGFGTGEGDFELTVPVVEDQRYHFFLVASASNDERSDASKTRAGRFEASTTVPTPTGKTLPWPARARPSAKTTAFHPRVTVERVINAGFDGFGVRLGEFKDPLDINGDASDPEEVPILPGPLAQPDPRRWFYPDPETMAKRAAGSADVSNADMHYMLHRRQIPSVLYPNVDGNLVQVTPLVRGVVVQEQTLPLFPDPVYTEDDPFFALKRDPATQTTGIFLLDTTPMSIGGRYQYYLTIFDPPSGEIRKVYTLNAIDVP